MGSRLPDEVCFGLPGPAGERDLSNKKIYQEEEMPESGAGRAVQPQAPGGGAEEEYGIVLRSSGRRTSPGCCGSTVNQAESECPFPATPRYPWPNF